MVGSLAMIAVNVLAICKKGRFGKGVFVFGGGDVVLIALVFFLKVFGVGAVVAVGICKFAFDDALEVHRHFYDLLIYVGRVGARCVGTLGMEGAKGFEVGRVDAFGVVLLCQSIPIILS